MWVAYPISLSQWVQERLNPTKCMLAKAGNRVECMEEVKHYHTAAVSSTVYVRGAPQVTKTRPTGQTVEVALKASRSRELV